MQLYQENNLNTRTCLQTKQTAARGLLGDHRSPVMNMKGPLVTAYRSPLMKALNRSVETLGL